MGLINVNFHKLAGQFGFYDNGVELNFFKNFGILDADFKTMFNILADNSHKLAEFLKTLEQKIELQFSTYCQKIQISNGLSMSAVNSDAMRTNHAYMSSVLFLGCRLLSQEFLMLQNADKVTFQTPITVYKPEGEKYSYKHYTLALRGFYETLFGWTLKLTNYDQTTVQVLNLMDEMLKSHSYQLQSYKKLFMLIWMYYVAQQMHQANEYYKFLDGEKNLHCGINNIPLKPVNFEQLFENVKNYQDPNKQTILENFIDWRDVAFIQKNKEEKLWELDKILFNEKNTIAEYFEVVLNIADCFDQKNVLNFKKFNTQFIDYLYERNKKRFSKEFIIEVLRGMFYSKEGLSTGEILVDFPNFGTYKKPIITFMNENNYFYVCTFPEFIGMSVFAKKEFILFGTDKRKEILNRFNEIIKKNNYDYTWKIPRRFANVHAYQFSQVPYFKNIEIDNAFLKYQPINIIYEETLNKCLLVFDYNFVESPTIWTDIKNSMRLVLGKAPIYQEFLNQTYHSWSKDFKKIKKQLKIPKNATIDFVLIVNRCFELYPRINFEEFDLYIIDIANLEFLLTNYIYKSMK